MNGFQEHEGPGPFSTGGELCVAEHERRLRSAGGSASSVRATVGDRKVQTPAPFSVQIQDWFPTKKDVNNIKVVNKSLQGTSPRILSDGAVSLSNFKRARLKTQRAYHL